MTTDLIPKNINPVALFSQNWLDPVLNEVLAALMSVCGLSGIGAKAVIEAIAKGKIPHIKIQY